ncbi:MAG: lipid A biosynthesis acyltransferase [Chloroflexi bacterium]|nr:lipid A biosynthesis acyltransferase [Chloroflexota bacterium]
MLTYYLFRAGRFLAPRIPESLAHLLCALAGDVAFAISRPARSNVMANIRHVIPAANPGTIKRTCRLVFRNTVENYYDLLRLPSMTRQKFAASATVHGLENMQIALEKGKGAIMLSIHMGNFNVVAQTPVVHAMPTSIIAENIQPETLYRLVNGMRESMGMQMIPQDGHHVSKAYKVLRRNEVLGMMGDRDIAGTGVEVEFFGETTSLPAGPVALALRSGAAIIPSYTMRVGRGKSIGFLESALELERTGDLKADVQHNTQRIARVLEGYIRRAPEQWTVLQPIWADRGK